MVSLEEKIKRKTFFVLFIILLSSWTIGYIYLNYEFKNSMEKNLQNISNSADNFLELHVEEIGQHFDLIQGIVEKERDHIDEENKQLLIKIFFFGIFVSLIIMVVLHIAFSRLLENIAKHIYTDQLTLLKNREALRDKLNSKDLHVVIVSNIKEFTLLNELYGIENGNEILRQVATAFKKFSIDNELEAYRTSADEFVLSKKVDSFDIDIYSDMLEKLHRYIDSLAINIDDVDESIGVEIYSGIACEITTSLENAQMALKYAKGKSIAFSAYSQNTDTKKNSEHILETKKIIRIALKDKNVVPLFQPIVDKDGVVVKYEALVRIIEDEKIIYPDDFLPVAMKSGLYIGLEKEMLTQSLEYFRDKEEQISINFLPNDFFSVVLMDKLKEFITKYDSPQRIVVEITEQEDIEDFDRLVRVINNLRKFGVMIAIDDFGSGFANYGHILKIKPDYIKIDGSLVKNILKDEDSRILVKSIISFSKDLGIKTIAEYIENEEIFELLKDYGVDEFQGYYFGRPKDFLSSW